MHQGIGQADDFKRFQGSPERRSGEGAHIAVATLINSPQSFESVESFRTVIKEGNFLKFRVLRNRELRDVLKRGLVGQSSQIDGPLAQMVGCEFECADQTPG